MRQPRRSGPIHVLVVDDSAVMRQCLSNLINQEDDMSADVAADPFIAMHKMKQHRPDVIILDLELPRMDGLSFLRLIMGRDPIPVVVCSGYAEAGSEVALRALDEGAVEVLAKPKLGLRDFLHESSVTFFDTIRGAAQARLGRLAVSPLLTSDAVLPRRVCSAGTRQRHRVVAMGASTGGTEALRLILAALPKDAPGIVVVMHMPPVFSAAFANHLNEHSRLTVKEAEGGEAVLPGRALLAPGDRHLLLIRRQNGYAVELRDGPLVSRHRPSVDVLFRSVAQWAGGEAVGVLLTGMGSDGAKGLLELREAGALTLAQDEATSVVYGMPKEAVDLGAVDRVVPLNAIPAFLIRR